MNRIYANYEEVREAEDLAADFLAENLQYSNTPHARAIAVTMSLWLQGLKERK